MDKYSVYIKFNLSNHNTTAGKNFYLYGNSAEEIAINAKELNKDKDVIYIEVASVIKSEPIKFFDGKTLELY